MITPSPKILIVDDEEAMVFSIQDYLSSYAECLGATSYDEAILMLEENQGISVVISDIRMPDKDGFDLLMWLHENRPTLKVIMITAYGSPSVRSLAKRKGAVRYLEKPLDLEQLLHMVKQIVEHKGFSVSLKDMELPDVLQFLSFANKAVRVQVFNPRGEVGEIGLDGEDVLWIRSGTRRGEEAFYEIMSWEGGSFEVIPFETGETLPEEEKLPFPLSFLLLEDARRRDEAVFSRRTGAQATTSGQEESAKIDIVKELAERQTGVSGFVESSITHKGITPEGKKIVETTWQKPVTIDADSKQKQFTLSLGQPMKVHTLVRDLKRASVDLDALLTEFQGKKYSGEFRSTMPLGPYQAVFYQGVPLLSSDRNNPPLREVRERMDVPSATLNFYFLGDELTHAFLSVIQGNKVWQGLSITMFHLDKMLDKLMDKNSTGHLCIHKENGDRLYCFFFQGVPLGVYDIEKHWSPVDPATLWDDATQVDYYLSGTLESFIAQAVTMGSTQDFNEFISSWNDLIKGIVKKLGKKPVGKSLQKCFGGMEVYALEGTTLQLAGEGNQSVDVAVTVFREKIPGFLKEMELIVGSHWLNGQLQEFRKKHGDIIDKFSLGEVLSNQGV